MQNLAAFQFCTYGGYIEPQAETTILIVETESMLSIFDVINS